MIQVSNVFGISCRIGDYNTLKGDSCARYGIELELISVVYTL